MKAHEIAILSITLVALVGAVLWLLYNGLRRRWPMGERTDIELPANAETGRLRLYMFVAEHVTSKVSADFGARAISAVWSCTVAWHMAQSDRRVTKDSSPAREVIVRIETAHAMATKAHAWGFKSLAGYISRFQTSNWGGEDLPLITISELYVSEAVKTGEPLIHELLHALERDYVGGKDDHSNPVVWSAAAGREASTQPSIQDVARGIYLERGWQMVLSAEVNTKA